MHPPIKQQLLQSLGPFRNRRPIKLERTSSLEDQVPFDFNGLALKSKQLGFIRPINSTEPRAISRSPFNQTRENLQDERSSSTVGFETKQTTSTEPRAISGSPERTTKRPQSGNGPATEYSRRNPEPTGRPEVTRVTATRLVDEKTSCGRRSPQKTSRWSMCRWMITRCNQIDQSIH